MPFDDFSAGVEVVGQPLVTHASDPLDQSFITYAGLWATARWMVEREADVDDMRDAMDCAMADHSAGAASDVAKLLTAGVDATAPPAGWDAELERLWPRIVAVADHFFTHGQLDHAGIASILPRSLV
ncbi:hypothetical protein [Gordonia desulfuricans]|uniref:hypothetical protein n=1 Tax=Gordonia desulfuricans TaxID=89051 RepID=UPI00138ABE06|nr:hypothetical protein [Gordonia desulfuricans]